MNKGLEVIEAHWLFDIPADRIDVVVHPQSIIHSMVEFTDGSVKAQLGLPDMKLPIQYALTWPARLETDFPRLDLAEIGQLSFEAPDHAAFPCLRIAYDVLREGGTAPAIMNAANEIAVEAFLGERIGYLDIPRAIDRTLDTVAAIRADNLAAVVEADLLGREAARGIIQEIASTTMASTS
jgi:1-deoxy-D-xylulose-5-phosphate reductoisomerase